jgi:hypothetical protein
MAGIKLKNVQITLAKDLFWSLELELSGCCDINLVTGTHGF